MSVTTFYPNPDAESTSVDGQVSVNGDVSNGSWSAKRDAATGDAAFPSLATANTSFESSNDSGNKWRSMSRSFFLFDTSALPDTDSISSAVLSVYGNAASNSFTGLSTAQKKFHIVASTPASNTNLTTADFDQLGSTSYANMDFASFSASAYNDFTLDSNGIAAITKTGVSKFGSRLGADLDNSEPTWESAKEIQCRALSADTAGTSTDPKLVVTHVASSISSSPSSSISSSVSPSTSISSSVSSSLSPSTSISSSISSSVSSSPSTSISSSPSASISSSVSSSLSSSISSSPSSSVSASPSPADWDYETKNTTTWSYGTKNTTSWNFGNKSNL